jgi:cytochrome c2
LLTALLTALVLVPAWAGGWAVITLDSLPGDVSAGQPFAIGFTVRQHGRTLLSDLDPAPSVEARLSTTGEIVRVEASDSGSAGHYTATLLLPTAGNWTWGIRGFGDLLQPMPPLHAVSAVGAAPTPGASPAPVLILAGGAAALGLGLLSRRHMRSATAVLGLAVVLALGGFYLGRTAAAPAVEAAASSSSTSGSELFLAKGCVMCHVHQAVPESAAVSLSIGPDLSQYHNSPDFLRSWLANPSAVRPNTGMPDLGLSAEEIDALIAFLNQDG